MRNLFLLFFVLMQLSLHAQDTGVFSLEIPRPAHIDPYSDGMHGSRAFAKVLPVGVQFPGNIVADTLDSGLRYRMRISSPDASSLGLCISFLQIQEGVELQLSGPDASHSVGVSPSMGSQSDGLVRTPQIPGSEILLEMFVPFGQPQPDIMIEKLYYDFSNLDASVRSKESTSFYDLCSINEDINSAFGADYQALKHSIVRYSFESDGYLYYCTGVLLNTTLCDTAAYLLTAAHCICNQQTANSIVSYFNFELESGTMSHGNIFSDQYLDGARLLATSVQQPYVDKYGKESRKKYSTLDFTLLQLPAIPKSYKPYFAGIHISDTDNSRSPFTIHHPCGGQKCIAISSQSAYTDNYPDEDPDCHYLKFTHWHIDRWKWGTTQGGSSGAPLFNDQNLVIGTLSGGYASCFTPENDYFAKISSSWDYYPSYQNQLRAWLAPNKDVTEIPPFDPYNLENPLPKSHLSATCNADSSKVHLSWNIPDNSLLSLSFDDLDLDDNMKQIFYVNIDHNTSQSYPWRITDKDFHSDSHSIMSVKPSLKQIADYYLVLPKKQLSGGEVLSFWARSSSGMSSLTVSYSSRGSNFHKYSSQKISDAWAHYEIDLAELRSGSYYINLNNVTSYLGADTLFIDDIEILDRPTGTQNAVCTGYQLYCNDELLHTFSDVSISSFDYDISKGNSYTFYILNLYGDNEISGMSNSVTISPGYVPSPSTAVGDIIYNKVNLAAEVFPNPSSGDLHIVADSDVENAIADIFDALGHCVATIDLGSLQSGTPCSIKLDSLESGTYLLLLRSGFSKLYSCKFIISH